MPVNFPTNMKVNLSSQHSSFLVTFKKCYSLLCIAPVSVCAAKVRHTSYHDKLFNKILIYTLKMNIKD